MKENYLEKQVLEIKTIEGFNGEKASFCPERGGIITSLKLNGQEILYLDEETFNNTGVSVKGGIPILFPNAGPLTKNSEFPNLSQHGFARNSEWQTDNTENGFKETLSASESTLAMYPYDFNFSIEGKFERDGSFVINQTIENKEEGKELPIAMGLHPYFKVPGNEQSDIKKRNIRFNFKGGEEIETSKDGNTQKVSAREMLQNGDFRYWLKGPIVTQVILEDRSTALKYDFGFKNTASFLATPNGYFRAGDTSMNVLDASDIPVPSVIQLFSERMRVCGKNGNTIQFGVKTCPNADGRKYGGTPEVSIAAWGEFATVEGKSGWRVADTSLFKAMHPIFIATFTPKTPTSTKVDMILENMWTQKLQDQFYDLVLKVGRSLTPVYSKANIKHIAKTRWRKTFYIGEQAPAVYIDFNLPYLAYTKAIPNFNPNLNITNGAINGMLETGYSHSVGFTPGWRNSDKGEPGTDDSVWMQGQIWKNQFDAGQRPDIGLFTTWQMVYLYAMKTSDARVPELFQELVGNGNAANMIPMFARESKTGKVFVSGMSDDMFGRSMSLDARPKTYSNISKSGDQDGDYQFAVDKVTQNNWTVDVAHFPNSFFIPYLFTGDYYFLEGMYNEASYVLHTPNPNNRINGKGLFGHEDRGVAWGFRAIGEAAYLAPDGSPEKKYFTQKMLDNIAVREGAFDIQNGSFFAPCTTSPFNAFTESSIWCIGKNKLEVQKLYSEVRERISKINA
jgi:galactose mutarotase-like enzyme